MLVADLAATSRAVASTSSRLEKVDAIAAALRRAAPDEVRLVVSYLSGELRQRRTGVGWASLRELPPPAPTASLEIGDVHAAFERAAGAAGTGSTAARRRELAALFGRATADEQRFLVMLAGGELRQGALGGVMTDAIARAAGVDPAGVRRATMLAGDLAEVADAVLREGPAALDRFSLRIGTPLRPMLAQTATSLDEALERAGPAAVEWKVDGVRIQVHREGYDVAVFTRTLDPLTDRVPEVVDAARSLPVDTAILDGEAIALRPDGRPRPFQETASRAASRGDVERLRREVPLTPLFFDLLHLDGRDLIDLGASERASALAAVTPATARVPRTADAEVQEAREAFDAAVAAGHEGVVVKAAASPYEAGRRGAGWVKVKPRHTLDLVVLAAEWGHGRRQGWLSNLHLGALDPAEGRFVMLGKTFKGLTDAVLEWQTAELLARETSRDEATVFVRPELVVEVAFDGIQRSSRYPGGMALRFARVLRYRPDKRPDEADVVDVVRAVHTGGA
jgi:DNA ligase 1